MLKLRSARLAVQAEEGTMKGLGFHHVDLGTRDMKATRAFYEGVLGFPLVRADLIEIGDKGRMQHFFFDVGRGQLIGFMSGEDVVGYPADFDPSINKGLGLPPGVYHFAFNADSLETLEAMKTDLEAHGVAVRGPVDHEGWCQSIYFLDPNGLQLECCHLTRPLEADDAVPQVRFRLEGRTKKQRDGREERVSR
jgi:glyoxylase I family protein